MGDLLFVSIYGIAAAAVYLRFFTARHDEATWLLAIAAFLFARAAYLRAEGR